MMEINNIFEKINNIVKDAKHSYFRAYNDQSTRDMNICNVKLSYNSFDEQKKFLEKILEQIDHLSRKIQHDETILLSVQHQKLLRTCFQLIISLGISPVLLPGLGLNLSKRCPSTLIFTPCSWTDEQKYEMLVTCTDFLIRSFAVPVLRKNIITLHLSDYLAALIQLSFAPLKKPGTSSNFTMTQEMFDRFKNDQQKYTEIYNDLVTTCFQPILMKELLVLQSATDPTPPAFVRRTIAKELSCRLLAQDGLLSLIRCFIEAYDLDTGLEWKKIDILCKIVSSKHGTCTEAEYLCNICAQLKKVFSYNNSHYLTAATACVWHLKEKYPQSKHIEELICEIFRAFDYDHFISNYKLPGTVILSPEEIEHKVNILHACISISSFSFPVVLILPNLHLLFLLGVKCTKNELLSVKLKDILLKCLEQINKNDVSVFIKRSLLDEREPKEGHHAYIVVEEYDAGVTIKFSNSPPIEESKSEIVSYFFKLLNDSVSNKFIQHVFEELLNLLIDTSVRRKNNHKTELLLSVEDDDPDIFSYMDKRYLSVLQLLSEICTLPKLISSVKENPSIVFDFIEYFILNNYTDTNEECVTIALVLLNTIVSHCDNFDTIGDRFNKIIPALQTMSQDESNLNNIICKEVLSYIKTGKPHHVETACKKAITEVCDNLLPVRAHGIMSLTKLIEQKDAETISKKHYIFCLFQEQLKNSDSYIYLSAINGIASLGAHCTEEVLTTLCREYLHLTLRKDSVETKRLQNDIAEHRMKIGDVIVKVTKKLGEMAIVHKTLLLNTILCACRDDDPLIRTSALSNLAEIARVLNYRMGTILCEVILCAWHTVETDKAVECRRAAVMVIASLIKGLSKETLMTLKDQLLAVYRTLKNIYRDNNEDSIVRLHAQIALEELNDIVNQFMFPELKMEKLIFVLDKPEDIFK